MIIDYKISQNNMNYKKILQNHLNYLKLLEIVLKSLMKKL